MSDSRAKDLWVQSALGIDVGAKRSSADDPFDGAETAGAGEADPYLHSIDLGQGQSAGAKPVAVRADSTTGHRPGADDDGDDSDDDDESMEGYTADSDDEELDNAQQSGEPEYLLSKDVILPSVPSLPPVTRRSGETGGSEDVQSAYTNTVQLNGPTIAEAVARPEEDPNYDDDEYQFERLAERAEADEAAKLKRVGAAAPVFGKTPDTKNPPPAPDLSGRVPNNPVEVAFDDVRQTANRLGDYAALQVAALTQWEKAQVPNPWMDRIVQGRADWLRARKAFQAYASGRDRESNVPDLSTLYVTPPNSATLSKLKLPAIALDPKMVDLARSLPGKLKAFDNAEQSAMKEVDARSVDTDFLLKRAGALSEYAGEQIERLAALEGQSPRKFLTEKFSAGRVTWEKAREALTAIEGGDLHTQVPDFGSLYVTPPNSASFNNAGLEHVTLDPEMAKAATELANDLRDLLTKM